MFRSRYHHPPGTAPATLIAHEGGEKPAVTLIEYDKESFEERKIEELEEIFPCRDNKKVSWVNVDGLDAHLLKKLGAHFGLHPLALEDVMHLGQRPKVEQYEDHLFIVVQMVLLDKEGCVSTEQVSIFLGRKFLITIQERPDGDVFEPVRQRIRAGRGYARSMKHDYLAYALLDAIIDHFFPVLERIGESIEELEDELVEQPSRDDVVKIHEIKRTLLHLRRCAWPEREVVSALNREESGLINQETKIFLRDCYDHSVQIIDMIENFRDIATGLMDLYLSSVSMKTNDIMRVLTVISAIFIPLNFIAGVYGMNFDTQISPFNMPELKMPYGYFMVLGLMAAVALGMLFVFRKKKWL